MNDPFPAVAEAAATGEIADLFADIRATVGVRVVNLVWRHFATFDGALPWAWAALKPLYLAGIPDQAARRFRESMQLPQLASLAGDLPAGVDAVLASYDHSNTINLFALGALAAKLADEVSPEGDVETGPRLPAPDLQLPALPSQADVGPQTWARVVRLNRFADGREPLILASMYRHLAHWPPFLEQVETVLTPVEADRSLRRAVEANKAEARERARVIARAIDAQRPASVLALRIERGAKAFVDNAIGKMVTVCRAIRVARGTSL
jgi:hypothetical protein